MNGGKLTVKGTSTAVNSVYGICGGISNISGTATIEAVNTTTPLDEYVVGIYLPGDITQPKKITISGGTIKGNSGLLFNYPVALSISGADTKIEGSINGIRNINSKDNVFTITGGTITGGEFGIYQTVNNDISILGGEITGGKYGINVTAGELEVSGTPQISGGVGISVVSSNAVIKGGIITGNVTNGIENYNGNLTIGEKGGEVSTSMPNITGETYGLSIRGGNVEFYDGIVKGKTDAYQITGKITPETGYGLTHEIQNDYKVSYLVLANYTDGTYYYEILNKAFANAVNNSTIKVLKNVNESTIATVAADKTFVLDLNGETITVGGQSFTSSNSFIVNNGNLTIRDSSA